MIVDSGAPVSIAEKECNRKFKMGENIYLSNREIKLSVAIIRLLSTTTLIPASYQACTLPQYQNMFYPIREELMSAHNVCHNI